MNFNSAFSSTTSKLVLICMLAGSLPAWGFKNTGNRDHSDGPSLKKRCVETPSSPDLEHEDVEMQDASPSKAQSKTRKRKQDVEMGPEEKRLNCSQGVTLTDRGQNPFLNLRSESFCYIASFLNDNDLGSFMSTCKHIRRVMKSSDSSSTFWKERMLRRTPFLEGPNLPKPAAGQSWQEVYKSWKTKDFDKEQFSKATAQCYFHLGILQASQARQNPLSKKFVEDKMKLALLPNIPQQGDLGRYLSPMQKAYACYFLGVLSDGRYCLRLITEDLASYLSPEDRAAAYLNAVNTIHVVHAAWRRDYIQGFDMKGEDFDTRRELEFLDQAFNYNGAYLTPNNRAWGHIFYARLYQKLGNADAAKEHLNATLNPDVFSEASASQDLIRVLRYRGRLCQGLNNDPQALQDYNRLLDMQVNGAPGLQGATRAEVLKTRGEVYYDLDNYQAALQDLTKALDMQVNGYHTLNGLPRITALFNRAAVYRELDNYQAALQDYTEALNMQVNGAHALVGTSRAMALRQRGLTHRELGNLQAALQDFDKALEMQVNGSPVLEGDIRAEVLKQRLDAHNALGNK